jgi:hypothetical protein
MAFSALETATTLYDAAAMAALDAVEAFLAASVAYEAADE